MIIKGTNNGVPASKFTLLGGFLLIVLKAPKKQSPKTRFPLRSMLQLQTEPTLAATAGPPSPE